MRHHDFPLSKRLIIITQIRTSACSWCLRPSIGETCALLVVKSTGCPRAINPRLGVTKAIHVPLPQDTFPHPRHGSDILLPYNRLFFFAPMSPVAPKMSSATLSTFAICVDNGVTSAITFPLPSRGLSGMWTRVSRWQTSSMNFSTLASTDSSAPFMPLR